MHPLCMMLHGHHLNLLPELTSYFSVATCGKVWTCVMENMLTLLFGPVIPHGHPCLLIFPMLTGRLPLSDPLYFSALCGRSWKAAPPAHRRPSWLPAPSGSLGRPLAERFKRSAPHHCTPSHNTVSQHRLNTVSTPGFLSQHRLNT